VKESATYFDREVVFDGLTGEGHGPDGYDGRARVPESLLDLVIEAAEECPGECIHVDA
jgi:ferredoxin